MTENMFATPAPIQTRAREEKTFFFAVAKFIVIDSVELILNNEHKQRYTQSLQLNALAEHTHFVFDEPISNNNNIIEKHIKPIYVMHTGHTDRQPADANPNIHNRPTDNCE